jgi:ABC-type transport system involved in cytochrome bd biosynthesis fused ATPase/permease subunit
MKESSDSSSCIVSLRDVTFSYDRGHTWSLRHISLDITQASASSS